jgi:hypothetical protein
MWVIDIRHWLGENLLDAGLHQLRLKVKKLGEIVSYATAIEAGMTCPHLLYHFLS